jgi:glutaredoxin
LVVHVREPGLSPFERDEPADLLPLYTLCQENQTSFWRAQMSKWVVAYVSQWCSQSQDTRRALQEWGVPCTAVDIKADRAAAARVREWVGFESAPTVVIAEQESLEPFEPPAPLPPGRSPRGVDRGSVITEASRAELRAWLVKHGMLEQ